ncbi:MAG: DoxX family protein [Gemmatimonadetes bacterium]|nr:DoxX family protein [Gemmatimonadota bacterium]
MNRRHHRHTLAEIRCGLMMPMLALLPLAAGGCWEVTVHNSTADVAIRALTAVTVLGLVVAAATYEPLVWPDATAEFYVSTETFGEGDATTGTVYAFASESTRASDVALMILRAALGMMIFLYGYNKAFRSWRSAGAGHRSQPLGIATGKVQATVVALSEMGVGVLLVLGLITQLATAGLIAMMVVASWTLCRNRGLVITGERWEHVALITAMSAVCATLGPGAISVDAELEIAHRLDGWTGFGIALLGGVGAGAVQILLFHRTRPKPEPFDTGMRDGIGDGS